MHRYVSTDASNEKLRYMYFSDIFEHLLTLRRHTFFAAYFDTLGLCES